jgi:hypothetical protein
MDEMALNLLDADQSMIEDPGSLKATLMRWIVTLNVALGLRYLVPTIRFTSSAGVEGVLHRFLYQVGETLHFDSRMYEILDFAFYASLVILALKMIIESFKDTLGLLPFAFFRKLLTDPKKRYRAKVIGKSTAGADENRTS